MSRRSLGVRSFALLAIALLGLRGLPPVAGDHVSSLAQRAVAIWAQPPVDSVAAGSDGDAGLDNWLTAYPDDGLFATGHILHIEGRANVVGADGPRLLLAEYRAAFPDFTLSIDDLRIDGDRATVRWTLRGSWLGPFDGLIPTGQRVLENGAFTFRVGGGQIVETWFDAHTADLLWQAGAVPLPKLQGLPAGAPIDPKYEPSTVASASGRLAIA